MPTTLSLPSPAKLNLFLHITDRRQDGYHNLQTIFQLLDYGDTLHFKLQTDGQILLLSELDLPMEQNLIWRAAKSLQQFSNSRLGATIQLEKRLPLGGGVGGGSSNAATTLLALNQLWDLKLPLADLAILGKQLGADIPVFIHGTSAWSEGIGDVLTPIDLPTTWYLVLQPPCSVNTAQIYAHPQLTRDMPRITIHDFLSGHTRNNFEPIVRQQYTEVNEALNWLTPYGPTYLTGSGSCVFATFSTFNQAMQVAALVPACYKHFIAKGVNRSPLHTALDYIEPTINIT